MRGGWGSRPRRPSRRVAKTWWKRAGDGGLKACFVAAQDKTAPSINDPKERPTLAQTARMGHPPRMGIRRTVNRDGEVSRRVRGRREENKRQTESNTRAVSLAKATSVADQRICRSSFRSIVAPGRPLRNQVSNAKRSKWRGSSQAARPRKALLRYSGRKPTCP